MLHIVQHFDIGNIGHPNPVGTLGNDCPYAIGIGGHIMPRIRSAGYFGLPPAQFQTALLHETQKMVSAQWMLITELFRIHHMEFLAANARVNGADALCIVQCHLFTQQKVLKKLFIMPIVGLLCSTKQRAYFDHCQSELMPRFEPTYCLVPAFFRISIPNIYSATSTIVSHAWARAWALSRSLVAFTNSRFSWATSSSKARVFYSFVIMRFTMAG